ncbi:MAG TPA: glycoside hydrolase family 31 protein [Acidobacteriaceae bacterium]|nr:glycoside hydrolase family 31 protein [Acidobacteriaceae bacterium]
MALRDDVIRVRFSRSKTLPEDASWAVLADARGSRVAVTPVESESAVGFSTKALRVAVDRRTLELTVSDAAGHVIQQDAAPIEFHGDSFRIRKAMAADEHFFGLGDKTGPLDRREQAFTLWNTDAYRFQESTDPLYKSIPFFMTFRAGMAAGVLLDNTWRSSFDFGKESRDSYSFGAENGPVDYYVFYGPSPKQVVETYAWLTGKPPLPPLWTLGYQQSRYSYMTESQVLDVAARLRADHIPADAIYLDIDYQDHNRPFTVNDRAFPDFRGMIAKLNAENFHVVAITDLHVARYPNHSYAPYDSGIAQDEFVKNADGSVYTGAVWPGPSVFPDFTRQTTRGWWGNLYRNFYGMGIAGFWNDMNEPSIFDSPTKTMPLDVVHRIEEPGFATRTATHAEIHNVYGMENSRGTFEGLEAIKPDQRPFVLTRATYAGGQRYAATWTGDNSSTWNHLRMTTPMLENLGLSGFAMAGADVGGYAGSPTSNLLTKWFEIAAFQPIDRDHTEKGSAMQEPWVNGPEQEAIRRRFVETRYRLMPYLYTAAEEASRTGVPIVRPLFLEFPDATPDRHPIDLDLPASAEFLFGPDILVAPAPFSDLTDTYSVEFPSAEWYDFWTGERVSNPEKQEPEAVNTNPSARVPLLLSVKPAIEKLPVYVRGGAIVPVQPLVQDTNETPSGPLTLRIYAGEHCAGTVYLDDGKTMAYRRGEFLRMSSTCEVGQGKLRVHIGAHEGSYPAWWHEIRVDVYGWESAKPVAHLQDRDLAITRSEHMMSFTVPDNGKGLDVELR